MYPGRIPFQMMCLLERVTSEILLRLLSFFQYSCMCIRAKERVPGGVIFTKGLASEGVWVVWYHK